MIIDDYNRKDFNKIFSDILNSNGIARIPPVLTQKLISSLSSYLQHLNILDEKYDLLLSRMSRR